MTTKEKLSKLLEDSDDVVSGRAIAEQLGMTRAAIWKAIQQLQSEGYDIESVMGKGYRLGHTNDVISENIVHRELGEMDSLYTLEVHDEITSTNTVLKAKANDVPDWYAIISGCQTAGRGRIGRSFYSPHDSGVYLSILLRPQMTAQEATRITTAAAVAACRAIEICTDAKPSIKWVNDVFIDGRKICGILTEASVNIETGMLDWAVMGIGLNVYEPKGGFPEDIKEIAGPILHEKKKDMRSKLAAVFMKEFYELCQDLQGNHFSEEYKKRSFLLGQAINVIKPNAVIPATVLDIDKECRLIVEYENGTKEALQSGEVSVRKRNV